MKVVLTFLAPGQTRMKVDESWQTRVCMKVVLTFLAPGQTRMKVDDFVFLFVSGYAQFSWLRCKTVLKPYLFFPAVFFNILFIWNSQPSFFGQRN